MTTIPDEDVLQMRMHLVRVLRYERTISAVWRSMQHNFPEYNISSIREAVRPVLRRILDDMED